MCWQPGQSDLGRIALMTNKQPSKVVVRMGKYTPRSEGVKRPVAM